MRPLIALCISDGRPGHYHRAEGILAAIARVRPVETIRLKVRRSFWLPGRALSAIANSDVSPARLLKIGYGMDAAELPAAKLVVSAGANTLVANVAAAKLLGATNIFYGRLRRIKPSNFSLILTSSVDMAALPNHALSLMPAQLDPASIPVANQIGPDRPPRTLGLLIGGDSGTIHYRPEFWTRLLAFMTAMHTHYGTRWIVSNSRRTPVDVSDEITRHAADATGPIRSFIDVRSVGPGTLIPLFADVDAVVCTVDSSSMISEAVWMRRPVVGITPQQGGLSANERGFLGYLAANGWVNSVSITDLSPERMLAALAEIRPLTANPLDLLAAILRERVPELFRD